jgi:uroporphyrinogen decarboxylase
MNSRERLLNALKHVEPDRVPYDLGSTLVTSINRMAYSNLVSFLGLPQRQIRIHDLVQQLAWVDEDVLQRLSVDTRGVFVKDPASWKLQFREDARYRFFKDMWGVTWRMPKEGGLYYDLWLHPLQGAEASELDHYPWPDPLDSARIDGLEEQTRALWERGEYAVIMGSTGMTSGLLQTSQWLLGFEDCYARLAGDRPFMEKLYDKLMELDLAFWEFFLPRVGPYLNIILYADDFGGQSGLLMSKSMFRHYFKPRYKQIFCLIKEKSPHLYIMFHNCGAIYDLIPELIDLDVDILNPIQVSAEGMDTKKLKREFGDALTFWGGINTQRILPRGTPQEVKDEVKRRIDDLAPGGGYVLNTVHNIQRDVPPQNIMAMLEALQEYGMYSLDG